MEQALARVARAFARAVGAVVRPRVKDFAKPEPEPEHADAEQEDPADLSELMEELEEAAEKSFNEPALHGAAKIVAGRAVIHSKNEFGRLGLSVIKEPPLTLLVDGWRKDNVARIKGMQQDQLDKIERTLKEGFGHRAETLAKEIEKQVVDVTASRARLIARDQVLTLHAQITRERQTAAGIERAVWTTSGDERVRDSHEEMDGVEFSWDDPPIVDGEPAFPGEPINCRCTAFPVLPELEDEDGQEESPEEEAVEEEIEPPPESGVIEAEPEEESEEVGPSAEEIAAEVEAAEAAAAQRLAEEEAAAKAAEQAAAEKLAEHDAAEKLAQEAEAKKLADEAAAPAAAAANVPARRKVEMGPLPDLAALRAIDDRADESTIQAMRVVFGKTAPTAESWPNVWQAPTGYDVEVKRLRATSSGHSLRVDADIKLPSGATAAEQHAGTMTRTFIREGKKLVVHHDFYRVRDELQGQGIGEAVIRSSIQSYLGMGVTKIKLDAHWVGRYTWARFGFSWSKVEGPEWQERLETFLHQRAVPAHHARELSKAALEGAHVVADLQHEGRKIGKEFLLDEATPPWNGELRLKDGDAGFEHAKARLKL